MHIYTSSYIGLNETTATLISRFRCEAVAVLVQKRNERQATWSPSSAKDAEMPTTRPPKQNQPVTKSDLCDAQCCHCLKSCDYIYGNPLGTMIPTAGGSDQLSVGFVGCITISTLAISRSRYVLHICLLDHWRT
jgi:hypothetical protein